LDASLVQVTAGDRDYDAFGVPPTAHADLGAQYGPGSSAAAQGRQRYFANSGPVFDYLALNTSRTLFSDVRVRKAVNYAIDRPALTALRGAYGGIPTDQTLTPGMPGFQGAAIYPLEGPDLTAAMAALPPGFAGGTAVLYSSSSPISVAAAGIVKDNLAELDIDVELHSFPFAQFIEKCGTRVEPFDICLGAWGPDVYDPFYTLNHLFNGGTIQVSNNDNWSYFDDPTFNARLDAAALLVGPAR